MLQEFNSQHNDKVTADNDVASLVAVANIVAASNVAVASWWRVWLKPTRAIALT